MGSFTIPSPGKILRTTTARVLGRVTAGTGVAEELTAAQVRTLIEALTSTQIAASYQPIGTTITDSEKTRLTYGACR